MCCLRLFPLLLFLLLLVLLPFFSPSSSSFLLVLPILIVKITSLSARGYRVIAIQYPVVWTHDDLICGLELLLEELKLFRVHLYGVSLGGYV